MLAHDLRNPLTAAKMTVERLAKKIDATSQSKRMMVSRLAAQIDRTDQMVSNLLDTNRIEGGQKLIVHPRNIDLGATLVDVVSDFLPGQERIRLNLPSEPVRGFGDPNALRRIVENLLSNAVKYGDSHQPITLTLEDVSFGPRIEVHNWGQPLPKEGREALFRPFVRAPEAVQSAQPGWGVGLALVRALAEAHGGHVSLQSTASRGTTFAVTLPRAT
jgi:signal transduction histidine kinase